MAVALVSVRQNLRHAAGTSYTTASFTAGTTGNHLICILGLTAGSGVRSLSGTVTDNGSGSSWSNRVSLAASNATNGLYIMDTKLGATPPTTITVTFSASVSSFFMISEWSGLDPTTWWDSATNATKSQNQSAGTTLSVPTSTPSASGELIIAGYAMNTAESSFTPDSNYLALGNPTNVGNCEECSQYRLSGTTSEAPGGSVATSMATAAIGAITAYIPAATAVSDVLTRDRRVRRRLQTVRV